TGTTAPARAGITRASRRARRRGSRFRRGRIEPVKKSIGVCVLASLFVGACASVPHGPSVMVLPGTGKDFNQFQIDDASCRQFASQQVGTTVNEAGASSTVTGAAVGTLLGAAVGAAIGAAAGSPATGAAVGAGTGLFGGTLVGARGQSRKGSAPRALFLAALSGT